MQCYNARDGLFPVGRVAVFQSRRASLSALRIMGNGIDTGNVRRQIIKQGIPSPGTLVYDGGLMVPGMSSMSMRKFIFLSAFLAAFIVSASASKAEGDGILNAVTYAPLPQKLSVEVRPFDDSDRNLEIKREIEHTLQIKGIQTSDNAPYVMSFEVRDRLGFLSSAGKRYILSFETKGGRTGGENTQARVNVFDSRQGGLLNKGDGDSRVSKKTVYRLEINLEFRDSGKRLWDAWAEAQLSGGDSIDLTRRMIKPILNNIGKTVKNTSFPLY
jgi:hypothetical protein